MIPQLFFVKVSCKNDIRKKEKKVKSGKNEARRGISLRVSFFQLLIFYFKGKLNRSLNPAMP